MAWTGDYSPYDAGNSGPLQDRLLFDLFYCSPRMTMRRMGGFRLIKHNLLHGLPYWVAVVVITNTLPVASSTVPLRYYWTNIQPAGVFGMDSALGNIVTNINNQRAFFYQCRWHGGIV